MASFEGTAQEFHHYIGPRIRNAVNSLTRKERLKRKGVCEFCGKQNILESAHVHGKGRREIIGGVLNGYFDRGTIRIMNINEVEQAILAALLPLSSTFKFICKSCHTEYDSSYEILQRDDSSSQIKKINIDTNEDFLKLHKLKAWGSKPTQINHKIVQAFRTLEKRQGKVLLSDLERECTLKTSIFFIGDRAKFKSNLSSMKTDSGHSHGKVFRIQGDTLTIFSPVKSVIDAHFPKP